jgi:hypothetical protein
VKTNKQFFGADMTLKDAEWQSPEVSQFKKFFSQRPMKIEAKSHEHALESIFLGEL